MSRAPNSPPSRARDSADCPHCQGSGVHPGTGFFDLGAPCGYCQAGEPAPVVFSQAGTTVCPGCGDILPPGAGHLCDLGFPTPGFVLLLFGIVAGVVCALLAVAFVWVLS